MTPKQDLRKITDTGDQEFVHRFGSGSDEAEPSAPLKLKKKSVRDDATATEDTTVRKSTLKRTEQRKSAPREHHISPSPPPPSEISRAVKEALAKDDAEIATFEKRLGLRKGKLPKSFAEDGLDSLLDGLSEGAEQESKAKRRRAEEEWFDSKKRKALNSGRDTSDTKRATGEESWTDDGDESSQTESGNDRRRELETDEDDDALDKDTSENEEEVKWEGFESDQPADEISLRVRENPYIAPQTLMVPAESAKCVPPQLKGPSSSEVEQLSRLRRQTLGLLNRLSEANLLSIVKDVEYLYRNNARQHMTSTLTELLLGLISDRSSLTDTFIILHGGFTAALYKIIGIDFGAAVVQRFVDEFERQHITAMATSPEGVNKGTSNLVAYLAELYNFQVIGSKLIFDFVRLLLEPISELNTELLLKIIKSE